MSTAPTAETNAHLLAFDLGASSGRAVLGTLADGRLHTREVHRFDTPLVERADGLFWDLERIWAEIQTGLAAALAMAPDLRSVSVDTWAVDYVPLGADGQALRDPYSYRDERTQGRIAQALAVVPAEDLYARTGLQLLEFNTLFQLLADRDDDPEKLAATTCRLLLADYLLYRLSGRAVAERTVASTTQVLNVTTGEWDTDLMDRFELSADAWPPVVVPGTVLGPLRADALPPGVALPAVPPLVVAACSHDTAAAVAAVPAETGHRWAYLSSGTWSLLGAELDAPVLTDAARKAGFTNEAGLDGTVRFLKNRTGMWVLEECRREWAEAGDRPTYETLLAEANAAESLGTIDLNAPAFGQRGNMPATIDAACTASGLRLPATRGERVRLIFESLAESYRQTLRDLEALTSEPVETLHVVGGGAQNDLLNQMTANACGCRVVAGPAEATAWGTLLVQARALGLLRGSIREAVRASVTLHAYKPSAATV